jgi:hypothetical protein
MMSMVGNDIKRYVRKWGLNCDFCGKRFNAKTHDFKVGEFDAVFCYTCHIESMTKRNKKKQAKIIANAQNKWLGDQLDEGVKKEIAKSLKSNERKIKIN